MKSKLLVALTFVQIVSKITCHPTNAYVISSYSNVRIQQPTMGLSVESQMPMEIMLNPVLADEPPTQVDKMESIFMKSDQIKNIKSMNIDEKEIMDSINKQTSQDETTPENIFDESDLIAMGNEEPAGFSFISDVPKATNWFFSNDEINIYCLFWVESDNRTKFKEKYLKIRNFDDFLC